jgi:hypothetical protein
MMEVKLMAEVWKLRQQAEQCRKAADLGGKKHANGYLRGLAEHYDKQADAAEARANAAAKPKVDQRV